MDWNAAFHDYSVVNQGIGGDKTSDVISRLISARKTKAKTVILEIGINDLIEGVEKEIILKNYKITQVLHFDFN